MTVISLKKILKKLKNKRYRDAYAVEHVQTSIPFQIRALREQRGWTQERLAREAKTTQTAISRVEDPNYGKLSLNSLYKLASAFDVALLVKFVPFSRLLNEFKDVSPEALSAESFDTEGVKLEGWANSTLPPNVIYIPHHPSHFLVPFIGNTGETLVVFSGSSQEIGRVWNVWPVDVVEAKEPAKPEQANVVAEPAPAYLKPPSLFEGSTNNSQYTN